jgi:hypothetical protein
VGVKSSIYKEARRENERKSGKAKELLSVQYRGLRSG